MSDFDPLVVLLTVVCVGFYLVQKFSDFQGLGDLLSGNYYSPGHSTRRINTEFNGIYHTLIAGVVIAGLFCVFSAFDFAPKRTFIPIAEQKISHHSGTHQNSAHQNSSHPNNAHQYGGTHHNSTAHQAANHSTHPAAPVHHSSTATHQLTNR